MHLMAGMALLPTEIPLPAKLAIWAALASSLMICLIRAHPRELSLEPDGRLGILDGDGTFVRGSVARASRVLGWLTVLLVLTDQGRRALVILPDSLDRDQYRKLRVWLKWRASLTTG